MKNKYDVIIIGSGLAGLVCGCYLAKNKFKVIIIEKHDRVGGYCSSFKRKKFTFDVGIHYFGAFRKLGELGRLHSEFNLGEYVRMKYLKNLDKVIMPNKSFLIKRNSKDTISEFKKKFPSEKDQLDLFFNFIFNKNFLDLFGSIRKKTFRDILDSFFEDEELKAGFEILLGNLGLPGNKISAVAAIALYKEFIFDGGYVFGGGTQAFSDALRSSFRSYGGDLLLSSEVKNISLKYSKISGVVLNDGKNISSNVVVSNSDATRTFVNLLDAKTDESKVVNSLIPSPSAFGVYLGLNIDISRVIKDKCTIWKFSSLDISGIYDNVDNLIFKKDLDYVVAMFPSLHDSTLAPKNKSTMQLLVLAPYKSKSFWDNNKSLVTKKILNKAKEIIPDLDNFIEVIEVATPHSFFKYTYNRDGSIYGWASTPEQISQSLMPTRTQIPGLFLCGHWVTGGLGQGGVASVVTSGRIAASKVIFYLRGN